MHEAWETGRKRTTIFSMEEGQQHYLDWISARDEMRNHLTELRLAAPSPIYVLAAQVSASAWRFGDKSLLAGTKEGMDYSSSEYQKTYDELAAKLIEEMQKDIYGTEINDVSIGPAIKSPKQ
jgi:hypothetical protein